VTTRAFILDLPVASDCDIEVTRKKSCWLLFPNGGEAAAVLAGLGVEWIHEGDVPIWAVVEREHAVPVFDALFDAGFVLSASESP
jgi:hypothetical protein